MKRIVSAVLVCVFLISVSVFSVGAVPAPHFYGDVNCNYDVEITDDTYETFAVSFHSPDYINYAKLQRVDTIDGNLSEIQYSIFTPNVTAFFHIDSGQKTCMILSNISLASSMEFSVRVI